MNKFKPSSEVFKLTVPRGRFFCGSFMSYMSCFVMLSCASAYLALWSPAGKGLTSSLSFVMSNYEAGTLPLVS